MRKTKPRQAPVNIDEKEYAARILYELNKEDIKLRTKLYYESNREYCLAKNRERDKTKGLNRRGRPLKDEYDKKSNFVYDVDTSAQILPRGKS